jgi:16S rRNA G527 N7-methylase RsmG
VQGRFDVITARAVAPVSKLLGISSSGACSTMWVLPRPKREIELAVAELSWHYDFGRNELHGS